MGDEGPDEHQIAGDGRWTFESEESRCEGNCERLRVAETSMVSYPDVGVQISAPHHREYSNVWGSLIETSYLPPYFKFVTVTISAWPSLR